MINIDKVSENVHYEMIPASDTDNEQAWDLRILEGDFTESVIRFGNVGFNEEKDCLTFNFKLINSPDNDLTEENLFLQQFAGAILEDILEKAVADGSAVIKEKGSLA
jgi:hypothetical protein